MTRIVFFGSSEHSLIILKSLINISDFELVRVISKPDKPVGRSQKVTPNIVSQFCLDNNLPLARPQDFDQNFVDEFRNYQADIALVVAYGPPYFTQEMIDIPKFKIVNIHPSPLPKYRGATPGQWQIIKGEINSGVCFFQIDALPDHGPIIATLPLKIEITDTSHSYYQKAFDLAASNLESVLMDYITHPTQLTPQDHTQKSYYPKLNKDDAFLDWSLPDINKYNFIRALFPWPIAWTYVTNQSKQKLKIKLISANFINKKLILEKVQIEGKPPTSWSEIEKYYNF